MGHTDDVPMVQPSPAGGALTSPPHLAFREIAPAGFGDRANTWAWSMAWWRGKLYVGTNRVWHCAERAGMHSAFPLLVRYPPRDRDAPCSARPADLPLQAEIWRWTPKDGSWERVFRSPRDVPAPDRSGKLLPREVGIRDLAAFVEPDGTEALYASGVNARFIFRPVPAPRLLRSTDGAHFAPVPHDPGTFLGSLDRCAFRSIVRFKGRMFVTVGTIQGDGILIESADPAAGNDSFRQVSPAGMGVFEIMPFNGQLYVGVRDARAGYAVLRTDAEGEPPYTFTPVVVQGAYLPEPSRGVISLQVFNGQLYVGTDRPATEIIRINPDDSWELVVGAPRETPTGLRRPLSGLGAGFNSWLNGHIWRMREYEGRLYVGTMKMATHLRDVEGIEPVLAPNYGFDLFQSDDGWHFAPVTTTGFGNKFACGLRSFAATPHGLAAGVANNWYGLQVWLGEQRGDLGPAPAAPERLELEQAAAGPLLSWEAAEGAARYEVCRALIADQRRAVEAHPFLARLLRVVRKVVRPLMPNIYLPPLPEQMWVPGAYEPIATVEDTHFFDTAAGSGERYAYLVRAVGHGGERSAASNIVTFPSLAAAASFERLHAALAATRAACPIPALEMAEQDARAAHALAAARDPGAEFYLLRLAASLGACERSAASVDAAVLSHKLARQVRLRRASLLEGADDAL
jgi:hypothetical protein